MSFPNFILAGFMKCGTTSLDAYLRRHPKLVLPKVKETDFFVNKNWNKGISWYKSLFEKKEGVKYGEVDPIYAKRHCFPEASDNIKKVSPKTKILFIVRDPIKRAISHYKHQVAKGNEKRGVNEALRNVENYHYIMCSKYAFQLKIYMKKFERERIRILDSKKMKQNPKSFLNNLFKIIGVEKKSINERIDRHRSSNKRRPSWVEKVVPGRSLPERGIRLLARMALPEKLTKGDPIKNVTLNDRVTRKVKNEIEEDVSEFRKISKRNFEHWSV